MAPQHQQQARDSHASHGHGAHPSPRLNPAAAFARAANLGGSSSKGPRQALLQLLKHQQQQQQQLDKQGDRWRSKHLGWHTAAIGVAGFAAVSADVFSPNSAHILQDVDTVGQTLAQAIDPDVRRWLFKAVASDAFITIGMLSWTALTMHVAFHRKPEASGPAAALGLGWVFYGVMAGRVDGDAWLVGTLKEFFHRTRPSPIHRSLSYPSGHTTSATFLIASLVFVFIPVLLHKLALEPTSKRYTWLKQLEASAWPLFGTAWVFTAVGRVGCTAHWVTDTVAAGFLSLALTSVLALLTEQLLASIDEGEGEGESKAADAALVVVEGDGRKEGR